MANEEHLEILRQGVEVWNRWRNDNPDIRPDLTGGDLYGLELRNINFSDAKLNNTELQETDLSNANLRGAWIDRAHCLWVNLEYADLREAIIQGSDLTGAYLNSADLRSAHFINSNLSSAHLDGANFEGVELSFTIFGDNDLSVAKGLDKVYHAGPSIIGTHTLYRSSKYIPIDFLRGVGLPDNLIEYFPSLFKQPIQFYSCFISYSTKDEEFARRLCSRMRDEYLRVWFAPEDIKGGEKIHEQLERAIQLHDRLLLVISEHSIQSEWVMTEIRKARKAEVKEKRRKLFPIRLVNFETIKEWECFDADNGKDLAVEVREYFIPDFSNWKDHDAFEQAFGRLLRDLRAEEHDLNRA